eukprot:765152-Hanusia_phi.AAC.4
MLLENASNRPTAFALRCRFTMPSTLRWIPLCDQLPAVVRIACPATTSPGWYTLLYLHASVREGKTGGKGGGTEGGREEREKSCHESLEGRGNGGREERGESFKDDVWDLDNRISIEGLPDPFPMDVVLSFSRSLASSVVV